MARARQSRGYRGAMTRRLRRPLGLLMCVPLLGACSNFQGGTYLPMQQDFDRMRANDLLYLFDAISTYRQSKGFFPFERNSDSFPTVVVFETAEQAGYHKGRIPIIVDLESRL